MTRNPQLLAAKQLKLSELKEGRTKLIGAPLNNFDVDSVSDRENINGAIDYFTTLSQGTGVVKWTMADNTEANVTLAELQAVKDGYVLRKGQLFAQYQQLKQAVESATTIEELENIKW